MEEWILESPLSTTRAAGNKPPTFSLEHDKDASIREGEAPACGIEEMDMEDGGFGRIAESIRIDSGAQGREGPRIEQGPAPGVTNRS